MTTTNTNKKHKTTKKVIYERTKLYKFLLAHRNGICKSGYKKIYKTIALNMKVPGNMEYYKLMLCWCHYMEQGIVHAILNNLGLHKWIDNNITGTIYRTYVNLLVTNLESTIFCNKLYDEVGKLYSTKGIKDTKKLHDNQVGNSLLIKLTRNSGADVFLGNVGNDPTKYVHYKEISVLKINDEKARTKCEKKTAGIIICPKCGSNNTKYKMAQIRSGDEGATMLTVCREAGCDWNSGTGYQ